MPRPFGIGQRRIHMFFAQLAKRRLLLTLPFLLLAMVQFAPAAGVTGHARAASLSNGTGNSGTIKVSEDTAYQPPTGGSNEPHVTCPFWIQGYYFPGDHGTLSVSVQAPAVFPQTVGQVIIDKMPWSGTHHGGGYFFNLPDNNTNTGFRSADGFVSGGHYELDVT